MQHPFFYIREYDPSQVNLMLDDDTSRHVVSVLRMNAGDLINLTDGKGNLLTAAIVDNHKKHCEVRIQAVKCEERPSNTLCIGISLLKNASRFEWFLEKATEIGVSEIIPLICDRTERQKFRFDRMLQICTSAILQSQQCWLPALHEPVKFENFGTSKFENYLKLIAHCMDGDKRTITQVLSEIKGPNSKIQIPDSIALIGPEGDFTAPEIQWALKNRFIPVSLGETRLRTETAGVAAAILLKNCLI